MVKSRCARKTANRPISCILGGVVLAATLCGTASASSTAVTVAPASATVSGSSPATVTFPLERAGDLGFDTWLHYQTENGKAIAGTDYIATGGDVKVPAGATEASIPVQALGASAFSPDKQFKLMLLGAAGVGPTPSFAERQSFAAGSLARETKVADVNGDGKPDLIVPNLTTVSVLLNTTAPGASTPSFAAAQSFAVGGGPEVATPTDVNGDGLLDLVVANGSDDDLSVLLNTTAPGASTASFAVQQVFEGGRGPRAPVMKDLNGDGRPDLMLVNNQFDEHAVAVFFNTTPPGASTVSFQPRQYFEFFAPRFVVSADVNGDGVPDLIVTSQAGADKVWVFLNSTLPGASDLSLLDEQSFPTGERPNAVKAADVNGDGRPDLVVSNGESDTASVLLNTTAPGASTPSFAAQRIFALDSEPRSLQTVDLNGDGRIDVVAGNFAHHSVSVLLNTTAPGAATPSFAAQTLQTEPLPFGVVTADLNGDGRQDLIYTREGFGKLLVSLSTTGAPTGAAPSLAVPHQSAVGDAPASSASTDLNGDGVPDLAVANEGADTASVLLNTTAPGASTPSFAAQQPFATGGAPSAVTATDLNGDGKPDLLLANHDDDTASVLFNTTSPGAAAPSFTAQQTFATGSAPTSVSAADLNGDGVPDLLVANRDDDTASVLLNTTAPGASTPSFAAQQEFATGGAPSAVTTADLNGDGKPDLIVANHDDDTASVLFNTTAPGASTPSFAVQQAFATGEEPSAVRATDLNGDGVPDLAVANEGADTASVLLNTTTPGASIPSFAAQQEFSTGGAPTGVTTTDLNGDGVPDLLVANHDDDTASVLLNTTAPGAATPSFGAQQAFAAGDGPTSVTTADLNGDGGPDVVAADGGSDEISALLDTQYAASVNPASVIGTIHYAIPQATLSPVPLAFGEQVAGSSASRTETVSNTGGAELAIKGVAIGGADAAEFSQQNSCPPTLAVGASCSIGVTFAPNAAAVASAALIVASNAPSSPDTVALSGTGTEGPPPPNHTLSVTLTGGGKGSVDGGAGAISCPSTCSHAYANGTSVTLTAIPAPGSTFAGWSGGGCTGARTCQLTIGADTALSASFEKVRQRPRPHVLVSYRLEGGIGGPRPALVVYRDRGARVTLRGCTAKFELRLRAWRKLRAALRDAHLHAIAGNYPAPNGSADVITYVIMVGPDAVRIAPASQPENEAVMRDLEPLLKVLGKMVSGGERRMPPSCRFSR
jgi:trimeric autotransporter adhesin